MTWLLAARAFLKGIPWQVWAGIGVIVGGYVYGEVRYSAGKEVVIAKLKRAEARAAVESAKARLSADEKASERADNFKAQQETLGEVIKDAQDAGSNPLDSLFGSM